MPGLFNWQQTRSCYPTTLLSQTQMYCTRCIKRGRAPSTRLPMSRVCIWRLWWTYSLAAWHEWGRRTEPVMCGIWIMTRLGFVSRLSLQPFSFAVRLIDDSSVWRFSTGWALAQDDLRVEAWSRQLITHLHAENKEPILGIHLHGRRGRMAGPVCWIPADERGAAASYQSGVWPWRSLLAIKLGRVQTGAVRKALENAECDDAVVWPFKIQG